MVYDCRCDGCDCDGHFLVSDGYCDINCYGHLMVFKELGASHCVVCNGHLVFYDGDHEGFCDVL